MTNTEKVLDLIRQHPEGLDDDEITEILGIKQRQQVYQICTRLKVEGQTGRGSVGKPGKRKKIHNFPIEARPFVLDQRPKPQQELNWQQRLNALVAATGKDEDELLNEALHNLAIQVLKAQEDTCWTI